MTSIDESEVNVWWGLVHGAGKELIRTLWPKPNPVKATLKALKLSASHDVVLARAQEDLKVKTGIHQEIWQIDQVIDWALDQDEGILRLKRSDGVIGSAFCQIVGTFNSGDDTWLWSWANVSIANKLAQDSELIRQYGRLQKRPRLTEPTWKATQKECWDMTALAVLLNGAQGAYRGQVGNTGTFLFMTFRDVQLSKP